ncbi:MAG: hypothetical protein ACD_23C00404G0006, partial [uncultured bacterium]
MPELTNIFKNFGINVNQDRFVTTTVCDGIATIAIDNPPVNALSNGVRQGIQRELSAAQTDPKIKAIVLRGIGRTFCAGADIREFGKVREQPWTAALALSAEKSSKPVVAVIHG